MLSRHLIVFNLNKRSVPKKVLFRQDFWQKIQETALASDNTKFHESFHKLIGAALIVMVESSQSKAKRDKRINAFFNLHCPRYESLKE
jgi:hypothetical protein